MADKNPKRGAGPYTGYGRNYRPVKSSKGTAAERAVVTALGGNKSSTVKSKYGNLKMTESGVGGVVASALKAVGRAGAKSVGKSAGKSAGKAAAAAKPTKPTAAFSKGGINARYTNTPSGSTVPKSKRGSEMMTPQRPTAAQKGAATKAKKKWDAENAGKPVSQSKPSAKPASSVPTSKPKVKTNWSGMKPSKKTTGIAAAGLGGAVGAGALAAGGRKMQKNINQNRAGRQVTLKGKKK